MADRRISDLTSITGAQTDGADLLTLVDVSDSTMAPSGTNKKITVTEFLSRVGNTFVDAADFTAKGALVSGSGVGAFTFTSVGANGTVLTADSSAGGGVAWAAVPPDNTKVALASFTAKGDLLVGTGAGTLSALTVGTNGHALVANSATATGLQWAAVGDVTLNGIQTLTNKTLTTPVITSISNSGTITVPTGTDTLVARNTTDTLTNKTLTTPVITSISNSGTVTVPAGTDTLVARNTTDTLTNKTLTAPTINGGLSSEVVVRTTEERWNNVAAAATGTINFDALTASVWRYTSNASANWTLNFRGSSSVTMNTLLAVGDSITLVFASVIGATQFRPTTFQIDGSAVTPLWQGGTAPTAGNANSTDFYSFTIVKTAATPTYVVYASQTRFA